MRRPLTYRGYTIVPVGGPDGTVWEISQGGVALDDANSTRGAKDIVDQWMDAR